MTAAAVVRDPFAGDAWTRLKRRIAVACAGLRALLAPRLKGSRLRNAAGILGALDAINAINALDVVAPEVEPAAAHTANGVADPGTATAPAPDEDVAAEIAATRRRCAEALPPNLRKHIAG